MLGLRFASLSLGMVCSPSPPAPSAAMVLQGPQDVPLDMVERLFWALAHTAEPRHCPSVCPQ